MDRERHLWSVMFNGSHVERFFLTPSDALAALLPFVNQWASRRPKGSAIKGAADIERAEYLGRLVSLFGPVPEEE